MPNCPSCGRFMSRGLMEEETEQSSKVFECDDHGEKVVTDPDGYWDAVDAEIRKFTSDDPRLPENQTLQSPSPTETQR